MERRTFVKTTALAGLGMGLTGFSGEEITHVLSLSFDDGFKKSFYRIAEIHEEYDLSACLNVIATGHLKHFNAEPRWAPQKALGNFDDWNTLKARGHEIMPHSWEHLNLTEVDSALAKDNIDKCLDYFETHLEGYTNADAVYNFAYNASNPELDAFALERVRAIRTGGWLVLADEQYNAFPPDKGTRSLGCWGEGPENCDAYVLDTVDTFLKGDGAP